MGGSESDRGIVLAHGFDRSYSAWLPVSAEPRTPLGIGKPTTFVLKDRKHGFFLRATAQPEQHSIRIVLPALRDHGLKLQDPQLSLIPAVSPA
jgi:hypothetical protein